MYPCARSLSRARQTLRQLQRMHPASARIAPPAGETARAGRALHGVRVEPFGRNAPCLPLRHARPQPGQMHLLAARLNPAVLHGVAVDAEPRHQRKEHVGRPAGKFGRGRPPCLIEGVGVVLQAGDHLTAIASRCAEARILGFEQHDVGAGLGEVQRR